MENDNNSGGDCQQTGKIYKITNLVNGKIYVGQTKQQLEKRMNQHKHNSKTDKSGLAAALRKYGWENFKVEVLEICPIDKLDEREIFWIAELNSKAPAGYNLTDGGEGTSNPSAEARAKMSAAKKGKPPHNKGKKHSVNTLAKISAANKGKPSPFKGRKMTAEQKARISANHADFSGDKNPNYGKHHSAATKAKISAKRAEYNGEKHPMYGKHHTAEAKAKMSASAKATWARRKALAKGGDS